MPLQAFPFFPLLCLLRDQRYQIGGVYPCGKSPRDFPFPSHHMQGDRQATATLHRGRTRTGQNWPRQLRCLIGPSRWTICWHVTLEVWPFDWSMLSGKLRFVFFISTDAIALCAYCGDGTFTVFLTACLMSSREPLRESLFLSPLGWTLGKRSQGCFFC